MNIGFSLLTVIKYYIPVEDEESPSKNSDFLKWGMRREGVEKENPKKEMDNPSFL